MKRRMSHALAMRSTWMPRRVTQVRPRRPPAGSAAVGGRGRASRAEAGLDPASRPSDALSRPDAPKKSIAWISESLLRNRPRICPRRARATSARPPARRRGRSRSARLPGERGVVGLTRRPEEALDALRRECPSRKRDSQIVASPRPATTSRRTHWKSSRACSPRGQDVDGVLHGHRSEGLEPPPDLHAQVVGAGGIWWMRTSQRGSAGGMP